MENAAVERSFSANKELLVDNLHKQSLVSLRSVHLAIIAAGDIRNIDISKALITAFCSSSAKCKADLEEKRAEEVNSEKKKCSEENKGIDYEEKNAGTLQAEVANALQTEINQIRRKMKPF